LILSFDGIYITAVLAYLVEYGSSEDVLVAALSQGFRGGSGGKRPSRLSIPILQEKRTIKTHD
jgi:hypothetical protein